MRELRRAERVIARGLRRLLPALRLALVAAPVAWLARRVDAARVLAALGSLPPAVLAHAAAWSLLAVGFFTWRYRLLLRAWGDATPSFAATLALVLRAMFWNLLPGGVVGDLARSDAVRHRVGGLGNALAAFWFERVGGLAGLFVVALAALALAPSAPAWITRSAALGAVASLALLAVSLAATRSIALARRLAALPLLGPRLGVITAPARPADLARALIVSLGTQSATAASIVVVVHALAPAADLRAVAALSPAAILFTFVPLTPGAVGQREVVFSMVFAFAGVEAGAAVAASVVSFAVGLLAPCLGGALVLGQRRAVVEPHER